MSRTGFFLREDGSLSAVWRFVFIVVVFLLAWPPICGIVIWWIKIDDATSVGWLAAIAIYAYLFGAPSAFLSGVIHAVAAVNFRHYSILVPVATAVLAAILIEKVIVTRLLLRELADATMSSLQLVLFASLIASLGCWFLTRQLARMA